jgi:hypothetical protein
VTHWTKRLEPDLSYLYDDLPDGRRQNEIEQKYIAGYMQFNGNDHVNGWMRILK